jgi:hypothetical protein
VKRFALIVCLVLPVIAQTPRPDDTPSFKVGATIFADYVWQQSPRTTDADGNRIHANAFNVTRAYINVTGNLNHWISYRITPDVVRETGSGSSLSGSLNFRLKYAFAQFGLDDWVTKGAWVRFGIQQTPYLDYSEGIYRYRFQGTMFPERVLSGAAFTSSDAGISMRYPLPGEHGEIHGGFYNGEGYSRAEANDEKAFQIRATFIPMPKDALWKGLRLTAFVDEDHYVAGAKRERFIGQVTFQHPRGTLGLELVRATDRTSSRVPAIDSNGWSLWATPKIGKKGWELLLRHDDFKPNDDTSQKARRNIAGIAYWVPNLQKVTVAVLLDYDSLVQSNFTPARADDTRYGVKLLINF